MDRLAEAKLKITLNEIIQGYSVLNVDKFRGIFVKHFNFIDNVAIDIKFSDFYKLAIKEGLETSGDKLSSLISGGTWAKEKEDKYKNLPRDIDLLIQTRKKLFLEKDIDEINKRIEALEKEFKVLENERTELIGYTAEVFATKKSQEYFVFYAFRKSNINEFYFNFEEFDELDEEELLKLIEAHNQYAVRFSTEAIKRVAISHHFMNMIYVAGEEIYHFYGKPVVQLTFKQMELFNLGLYYRHLLREMKDKITPEMLEDPDKLVEAVELKKTIEEKTNEIESKDASGVAIVGATKTDLAKLGMEAGSVSLSDEASKKGGSLNMEELMRIHGV